MTPSPSPLQTSNFLGGLPIDFSSPVLANAAAVISLLVALIGILVSLLNVRYQIKRQWLISSAEMVTDFEKRFVSTEWKEYRTHCGNLLRLHWEGKPLSLAEDFQVLGMFEHLALLVHRRVLDFEMVWSKFGWYYVRYYEGLREGPVDAIDEIRRAEGDPTLWEEFEWFHHEVVKFYRKRSTPIQAGHARDRVEELITQETALMKYSTDLAKEVSPSRVRSILKKLSSSMRGKHHD